MAHEVAKLAYRSPINDSVSVLPSPDRPSEGVCSYISVHTKVADKSKSYISKYAQFVVEYVIEWEKVVTGRISVAIKKAEGLRRDLDHYQQKVESLRQSANQAMAKGKNVDSKTADKLSRNEEKFVKSKQEYDVFATDLCILIEEVTDRSWRDLHPLMIKLAQFDMTMADDESKNMAMLKQVVKELKDTAERTGLPSQPRLKDIEHQKPELLNTRGSGGEFRIEADPNAPSNGSVFGSPTGSASVDLALPPGSIGPQGLGGFPVQVKSADKNPPNRSSSFASDYSGTRPSTSDILQMGASAAPPPTLSQLNESQTPSYGRSNSGGLPPLGPGGGNYNANTGDAGSAYGGSAYGSNFGGGSAYASNDNLSTYSGASAPAPAAPPPPPPPPSFTASHSQASWNQPSYGQTPAPSYGAPPAPPTYGAQVPSSYGAPMPPLYSAPMPPSYGAPVPPPYGAPAPSSYGAPAPPSYGQAPPAGSPNPFGAPPAPNPFGAPPPANQQYQNYGGQPSYGGGTPLNSTNPFG